MLDVRHPALLVTDFDGTMTQIDFFERALAHTPPEAAAYWQRYLNGELSHFDALAAIFHRLPDDEDAVMGIARETGLDPGVAGAVAALEQAGWGVVIASAGCEWYIHRLLEAQEVRLRVVSNPGSVEPGRGLVMRRPEGSPFYAPETGIDKAAVVRGALEACRDVAFAGDGRPDLAPARLVPAHRRFARGWLAGALRAEGLEFHPYERWSDIAGLLTRAREEAR